MIDGWDIDGEESSPGRSWDDYDQNTLFKFTEENTNIFSKEISKLASCKHV